MENTAYTPTHFSRSVHFRVSACAGIRGVASLWRRVCAGVILLFLRNGILGKSCCWDFEISFGLKCDISEGISVKFDAVLTDVFVMDRFIVE